MRTGVCCSGLVRKRKIICLNKTLGPIPIVLGVMRKKKRIGKEVPWGEELEIQSLGPNPKHNSAPHADLFSSANPSTREEVFYKDRTFGGKFTTSSNFLAGLVILSTLVSAGVDRQRWG